MQNKTLNTLIILICCLIPIALPINGGVILNSISEYAGSDDPQLYTTLLITYAVFLIIYGALTYKPYKYGLLSFLLFLVIALPVQKYRIAHDTAALLFFFWYAYITIRQFKSKFVRILITTIAIIMLILAKTGVVTLFFAETIGLYYLSWFYTLKIINNNRFLIKFKD